MLGEAPDPIGVRVGVGRDEVNVAREIRVPSVVALRGDNNGRRIGQPGGAVVLEVAGCQVAGRSRPVSVDQEDMLRAVEDPVLAIETCEQTLDLAG